MLEALCGWLFQSGEPGRAPARIRGELASAVIPGLVAAIGTLTALEWRRDSGEGQLVEISAHEAMLAASRLYETTYAYYGLAIKRLGPILSPTYGYRPASDGWVALCAATDARREMVAHMTGMSEHLKDPLFSEATGSARAASSPLVPELDRWLAERKREDIFQLAQELRIPCGYVATAADVLALPQLLARAALIEQQYPGGGALTIPGPPFPMSAQSFHARRAPRLGEYNREVWVQEIGLAPEEFDHLVRAGVVG